MNQNNLTNQCPEFPFLAALYSEHNNLKEEIPHKYNHPSVDEQVKILKDVLEEMMTEFDTEENRMDFILDICNGYKKRLSENTQNK